MGKLTEFQLNLDLAAEPSVDGVCPFWQECHVNWAPMDEEGNRKKISDEYQCNWRKLHRVLLCGTYQARRREEMGG